MSNVRRLNPYQIHAFARRWAKFVVWDYHPNEHGLNLAMRIAGDPFRVDPSCAEIYEAMIALENAGVDCPVYKSTWATERSRHAKWLGVDR